jgi:hypothetical protein
VGFGKPVYVSSTGSHSAPSSSLVDGEPSIILDEKTYTLDKTETKTDYPNDNCPFTAEEYFPWFAVDLLELYKIERVIIVNRGQCCGEY